MARQKSGKKRPHWSDEELRELLRDMLLTHGWVEMGEVIEKIISAHKYGTDLQVEYQARFAEGLEHFRVHNYPPVPAVLRALNIPFTCHSVNPYTSDFPKKFGERPIIIPQQSEVPSSSRRLRLTPLSDRQWDQDIVLAFLFGQCLREIRERAELKPLRVDGTFVPLFQTLLNYQDFAPLEVVCSAIIEADKTDGVVWRVGDLIPHSILRAFYEELRGLPTLVGMYLGLDYDSGSSDKATDWSAVEPHPINTLAGEAAEKDDQRRRAFVEGCDLHGHSSSVRLLPRMRQPRLFEIDDIGLLARNLYHLRTLPDDWLNQAGNEKIRDCLKMRLEGLNESRIAEELGFKKLDAFRKFLSENRIGIKRSKYDRDVLPPGKIVEQWEKARDRVVGKPVADRIPDTDSVIDFSGSDGVFTLAGTPYPLRTKRQRLFFTELARVWPKAVRWQSIREQVLKDDQNAPFLLSERSYRTPRELFDDKSVFDSAVEHVPPTNSGLYKLKYKPVDHPIQCPLEEEE